MCGSIGPKVPADRGLGPSGLPTRPTESAFFADIGLGQGYDWRRRVGRLCLVLRFECFAIS
jgi:hypothetical protein